MSRATGDSEITFVLLSAGRFDLLEETLDTFFEHNSAPMARYLLIEDSGDASVKDLVRKYPHPFDVIVNDPRIGAYASVDKAYATVTTPYIFHCEDDWRFFRSGFVEESRVLLDALPYVSVVLCRRRGQTAMSDKIYRSEVRELEGIRYRVASKWADPHWLGYSFNPGLRRLADVHAIGSFDGRGMEIDASLFFKRRGMTLAALEEPACETTGYKRHVVDPNSARPPRRGLKERWAVVRHRAGKLLHRIGLLRDY